MKTYKIHLIRHGLTDGNAKGQYIGVTDLPLSPEGVRNLKNLVSKIDYPEVQKVYTSPLLRCRQTASVIYPDMPVDEVENLREYDFGEFEGKTASELENYQSFADWTSGAIPCPPGGEDTTEFSKRICLGFHEIVTNMMDEGVFESAVIMHGGAIMTLFSCTALPRRRSLEWTVENGRGYTVTVTPSLYHSNGIIEVTGEI